MSDQVILAIDQGTTGTTVLLFDRHGTVRGRATAEVTQYYPQPGWVEHDPLEIWHGTLRAINHALTLAQLTAEAIVAIGITNQRETVVVWDRTTGQPIAPAIVWQCRRTAQRCDFLKAQGHEERVRTQTGLLLDAYFSATKVAWLLDHTDGARDRASQGELAFGTIDAWLIWNLTGGQVHSTDPSNASRTLLYDIKRQAWDPDLCRLFQVPESMLPQLCTNVGTVGVTTEVGPLPSGIPIAGLAGDQQAALFGQGCFATGNTKNTYGTGCFLLTNTGKEPVFSSNRLLTTVAWTLGSETTYALEGSVFIAGAAVQWLRDELGLIRSANETAEIASSVPDNGGVYLVPAFVGLGAPHWDPYARGLLIGLTRGSSRAHVVRATLESIAYQTADLLAAVSADTGIPLAALEVDGGAAANDFLLQFQADILGLCVRRGSQIETTARGAAWLAGLGVGFWPDLESLPHDANRISFRPLLAPTSREELLGCWHRAVERSRSWAH